MCRRVLESTPLNALQRCTALIHHRANPELGPPSRQNLFSEVHHSNLLEMENSSLQWEAVRAFIKEEQAQPICAAPTLCKIEETAVKQEPVVSTFADLEAVYQFLYSEPLMQILNAVRCRIRIPRTRGEYHNIFECVPVRLRLRLHGITLIEFFFSPVVGPLETDPDFELVVAANHMVAQLDIQRSRILCFMRTVTGDKDLEPLTPAEYLCKYLTRRQSLTQLQREALADASKVAVRLQERRSAILEFVERRAKLFVPNLAALTGGPSAMNLLNATVRTGRLSMTVRPHQTFFFFI